MKQKKTEKKPTKRKRKTARQNQFGASCAFGEVLAAVDKRLGFNEPNAADARHVQIPITWVLDGFL